MYQSLPPPLRQWVDGQAQSMGLPDPDSYILLLIRLEKQNHDLAAIFRAHSTVEETDPLPKHTSRA